MERALGLRVGRWGGVLGALLAGLLFAELPRAQTKAQLGPAQAAVASESAVAASDALQVLARGGTAADAAIVAALVAGVAAPSSSGLGGGGFALGWDAATRTPYCIDFREVAPAGVDRAALEGRPLGAQAVGHLVGVPGEARGLLALHERAGRLAWGELVRIAQRRAEIGFPVSPFIAGALSYSRDKIGGRAALAFLFPGGKPALAGTRLTNPALARTLAALATRGPDAIYQGEIAAEVVATVRAHGGTMTLDDLAAYRVVQREPMRVRYAGADVYTMPPPSAGGVLLAQVLSLLPPDELSRLGRGSAAYMHLVAEAMRGAFADRFRYITDPGSSADLQDRLLHPNHLERRRQSMAIDRTHAVPTFLGEEHGTHALLAADRQRNVVSLTTTVNSSFGSGLVAEGAGIVLNDQLDDFATQASARAFGLEDTPNHPRPLARPVSSMTPTIVTSAGVPKFALGGSGGMRISTNVTQVLLDLLVFGTPPSQAVAQPRFAIPLDAGTLRIEGDVPEFVLRDLAWRGEVVSQEKPNFTAVQVLAFEGGRTGGAADARKSGSVLVH